MYQTMLILFTVRFLSAMRTFGEKMFLLVASQPILVEGELARSSDTFFLSYTLYSEARSNSFDPLSPYTVLMGWHLTHFIVLCQLPWGERAQRRENCTEMRGR